MKKENPKKATKKLKNAASLLTTTEQFQLHQLQKSASLSYFTLWYTIDTNCFNLFLEAGNNSS